MNDASHPQPDSASPSPETRHAALFTGMVLQQANMAMMFLGKAPRPDTDKPVVDLHAASLFIDTLGMLEVKTRGNLTSDEAAMLRETLTGLRIAFVTASDAAPTAGGSNAPTPGGGNPAHDGTPSPGPSGPAEGGERAAGAETDADRKKFVKRY